MIIVINFMLYKNNEEIHLYLKNKLCLEEYYGMNLDALYDMLSTYDKKVSFSFINSKTKYHQLIEECIKNSAKQNKNITII